MECQNTKEKLIIEHAKLNIAYALILQQSECDSYFIDSLFEKSIRQLKLLDSVTHVDYAAANYHRGRYLIFTIESKKYSKLDKARLMLAKECF